MGDTSILNRHRIYNSGTRKKPAELFRKDLISAMKLPDSDQLNPEDYILITDTWKEEWEKGVQVPVNPESLPDGSHVRTLFKVKDKSSPSNSGSDKSVPPSSPFKIPKKLFEFEPERDALASRYEMDLTDYCWLQSLHENEDVVIDIQEEMFEEVMNELEHQCSRNMKEKHVGIEFDDHIVCDICRSPDAEDGNEMVFCDLCNICVHQACYGIQVIPDGEWLCRPCKQYGSQADKKISCLFCPNSGGAFKPTSNNRWAHLSCALWIPEVCIFIIFVLQIVITFHFDSLPGQHRLCVSHGTHNKDQVYPCFQMESSLLFLQHETGCTHSMFCEFKIIPLFLLSLTQLLSCAGKKL